MINQAGLARLRSLAIRRSLRSLVLRLRWRAASSGSACPRRPRGLRCRLAALRGMLAPGRLCGRAFLRLCGRLRRPWPRSPVGRAARAPPPPPRFARMEPGPLAPFARACRFRSARARRSAGPPPRGCVLFVPLACFARSLVGRGLLRRRGALGRFAPSGGRFPRPPAASFFLVHQS